MSIEGGKMYILADEVKALEDFYLNLDFSQPEIWLNDTKNIEGFFGVWIKLVEYYPFTVDMFIHPLVIIIYQRFVAETTSIIETANLEQHYLDKAKNYRDRINSYLDMILEETTVHARELLQSENEEENDISDFELGLRASHYRNRFFDE
ncbi:MAG: hypothetical protein AAFV93_05855 [Chloroflexota bacterium]